MNKKNIIRIMALALAVLMLIGFISPLISRAQESWKEEVYVYGAGLNEDEVNITRKFLGAKEETPKIKILGADTQKYIKEESVDSQMISSVYIKKNNTDKVNVEIVTPLMIENVTSVQYANAALTAGISGLDIKVGAVTKVSGESALTGVYKALEAAGQKVDTERTKVAAQEIITVNEIAKDQSNNKDFTKEKLNEAVIEAKQKLVEEKEKNNGDISAETVRDIVQTVIKDNNLNTVLNQVNIEKLNVFFNNFINISNITDDNLNQKLVDLSKNATNMAKKELENVSNFLKSEQGQTYLESIKSQLSKENFEALKNGAVEKLNSAEVENLINNVKENISAEKLNSLIEGAGNAINELSDSGFFSKLGEFFKSIFRAIGDFFNNLF